MYRAHLLAELSVRPMLADGAMGTQLMARGLPSGTCCEQWNLDHSDKVEAIHREFAEAGCDLITTNTFCGSSVGLSRHGLQERMSEINQRAARLARRAAGEGAWVIGDIGPTGDAVSPFGQFTARELSNIFFMQAAALQSGGVDAFAIETMSDPEEMAVAIEAARRIEGVPIIATYAFGKAGGNFVTLTGATVREALDRAVQAGAEIVGANCGTFLSIEDYLRLAEELVDAAGTTPVIVQPNACSPVVRNGKTYYAATPSDLAGLATQLLDAGVQIVGGCCGTTPAHLHAMSVALQTYAKARKD
jgi:5-methyltetrahydrofolate--homocysteine methyltransferase